jgi:hypothetical protein
LTKNGKNKKMNYNKIFFLLFSSLAIQKCQGTPNKGAVEQMAFSPYSHTDTHTNSLSPPFLLQRKYRKKERRKREK